MDNPLLNVSARAPTKLTVLTQTSWFTVVSVDFSAAASSEKDHGSMNLASPVSPTVPSAPPLFPNRPIRNGFS
jgi:hypothetical protein